MKLIRCDECDTPIALDYHWLNCVCGLSGGAYMADGDRCIVAGPCRLVGVDNRVWLGQRVEAWPYDETKTTRSGKPKVVRLSQNSGSIPERALA